MPMGDPQRDALEQDAVRRRDALERMLDSTTGIEDLACLIKDLEWTLRLSRAQLIEAVLAAEKDDKISPHMAKVILQGCMK